MPISLTLTSNLFTDSTDQNVMIRDDVPVYMLLAEVQREYRLQDSAYLLADFKTQRILSADQTLKQLGIGQGATLVFAVDNSKVNMAQGVQNISAPLRPLLRAEGGQVFAITQLPALIGRPNLQQQLKSEMLAVDLTPIDPRSTSSRPHARLSFDKGAGGYCIESLRASNPVYVNDAALQPGNLQVLRAGDRLRFGSVNMSFELSSA